jgi:hypothetical protein
MYDLKDSLPSIAIVISLLSLAISFFSHRNSVAQKHNNLANKRNEFYSLARNVISQRLRVQFTVNDRGTYYVDKNIKTVNISMDNLMESPRIGGKKIISIKELAAQSSTLFPRKISSYILKLERQSFTYKELVELEDCEYHNWLFKKFKRYLTIR